MPHQSVPATEFLSFPRVGFFTPHFKIPFEKPPQPLTLAADLEYYLSIHGLRVTFIPLPSLHIGAVGDHLCLLLLCERGAWWRNLQGQILPFDAWGTRQNSGPRC